MKHHIIEELWKTPIIGQTIDAKLDSIYEGLGEIQKLVLERTKPKYEQRIVRRRIHVTPTCDPTKPGYPSISNTIRTFYSLEELEREYDQANSEEEDEILERINQLQLQCNMEAIGEPSQQNPLVVQDSALSGTHDAHPETQTNFDS